MRYQKPKGTRDIIGKDLKRIEAVCSKARLFFEKNGYEEIRTPTFEFAELFTRSIGEYTDIVEKENYTFQISQKVYMLRPEGTASVLRAIIENKIQPPCRFLYIEPMFRRERPQKGRYREFLQIGIELIGEAGPIFDAEMIDLGKNFMELLGAADYLIEINSIGCPQCRTAYKEKLNRYLSPMSGELCSDCKRRISRNFLRIFDCKQENCQRIYDRAPKITDNLCDACARHYEKVKDFLKIFGVQYQENKKMVRGLDYYTRTVFEFKVKTLGAQDTVLAGGRYDLLMKELGGGDAPALGWAMGVDRLLSILPEQKPEIEEHKSFFIATIGETLLSKTVKLKTLIQKNSFIVILGDPEKTIKQQLKKANRLNADYVIIFGEDEAKQKVFTVKDMKSGEQKVVKQEEFSDYLNGLC